jgi:hypothetical protein
VDPHPEAIHPSDAHAKALAINLDGSIYGTFAEIGAGQEVANWFLRVGAASGTVAQSICAYDKGFSDHRYGKGTRYVSRDRLVAMLDCEYATLLGQLKETRGATTRFFTFADTVAAKSFKGDNEQHGWVGVRFQAEPGGTPNDILLHVGLRDGTADQQQAALGVLGVNLVYGAYHRSTTPDLFLGGLFEGLSIDRVEVDVIELGGPLFAGIDARTWCLQALRRGMCHAVVFDSNGMPVEPATPLRKRALIVERGRFEVIASYQADMLRAADQALRGEDGAPKRETASIAEMTLRDATGAAPPGDAELLARVDRLAQLGTVVVSDLGPYYLLIGYLRRYTADPIRVVLGVPAMANLLAERFYDALPGSLLEGLGKLLDQDVKIYIYPVPRDATRAALGEEVASRVLAPGPSPIVTADDLLPTPPLDILLRYLRAAGWVVPIDSVKKA